MRLQKNQLGVFCSSLFFGVCSVCEKAFMSKALTYGAIAFSAVLVVVATGLLAGYYQKTDSGFDWRAFSIFAVVANWVIFSGLILITIINALTENDNVTLSSALKSRGFNPATITDPNAF